MTIAIINSKGGVGKTTTAIHLAAAIAGARTRVLLVDLDSQASASLGCGIHRRNLRPSSASCLLEKYPILKAIRHTTTPGLDLLTGSLELANADVALSSVRGRERAVRRMLEHVAGDYDLMVLDCPPGFSLLSVNALVAADALLVPVVPDPLGVEALTTLLTSVDVVRSRMGAAPRLAGILLSMMDVKRSHTVPFSERVRAEHRDKVFHTEIRWATVLTTAPADGKTVFSAAPRSAAADAFRRLAGEVLQRLPAIRH